MHINCNTEKYLIFDLESLYNIIRRLFNSQVLFYLTSFHFISFHLISSHLIFFWFDRGEKFFFFTTVYKFRTGNSRTGGIYFSQPT